MTLVAADYVAKGDDLAVDVAKQFMALSLGGIAFAVGVTATDTTALHQPIFWWVIGAYGVSTLLGFLFLMVGVSRYASGNAIKVYVGAARWAPLLQIVLLVGGTALLLQFHVDTVSRKAGAQETKLTIQQGGKVTSLAVTPGKSVTISVAPSGELRAEVK